MGLRNLLRACENPDCRNTAWWWRLRRGNSDGIRLQGRWYCGADCFEQAAQAEFKRLCTASDIGRRKVHRMPFGLLMLSRGMITDVQLRRALSLQRGREGARIGKFLQEIGAATEQDIAAGLAAQWGCPVYPLKDSPESLHHALLLPRTLLEAGRMLPVHILRAPQTLYLAFVEGIDRNALYAVEQMLGLRTIPCIVSESAYRAVLEELNDTGDMQTTVFESRFELREMVRTTRSYAMRIGASEVWMVRSGRFVWARLRAREGPKDILFRAGPG